MRKVVRPDPDTRIEWERLPAVIVSEWAEVRHMTGHGDPDGSGLAVLLFRFADLIVISA